MHPILTSNPEFGEPAERCCPLRRYRGGLSEILVPGRWVQVKKDDGPTSVPANDYGGLFADAFAQTVATSL